MFYVKSIFLFCITFLIYTCSLESNEPEVQITTDLKTYIWSLTDSVYVKVKNTGNKTLYYLCTGEIFLEEQQERQIINTWKVHGFEECLRATQIEPDLYKVFPISAHEGEQCIDFLITSPFSVNSKYTFRVILYLDKDFKNELPFKQSRSDQIVIEP